MDWRGPVDIYALRPLICIDIAHRTRGLTGVSNCGDSRLPRPKSDIKSKSKLKSKPFPFDLRYHSEVIIHPSRPQLFLMMAPFVVKNLQDFIIGAVWQKCQAETTFDIAD